MAKTSCEYELTKEYNLRVSTSHDTGDLRVSVVGDYGYENEKGESDLEFWVGATLFWYDMDSASPEFNKQQIDAIARLGKWLKIVPTEEMIEKYAVPAKDEVLTYNEQVDKLAADGYAFAIKLKSFMASWDTSEGAD